jgi:hypothetical protein
MAASAVFLHTVVLLHEQAVQDESGHARTYKVTNLVL